MRPIKLTLDTNMDNGWMYRVYRNQAAASYLSLISLSPVFKNFKFSSHFSQELWGQKSLNLIHLLIMGGCIVYTRIRLLPLVCPFISSNIKHLQISSHFFSGAMRTRKLKLGTHVDNGACIVYTGIRLLLLICRFICPFFFFSNFQLQICLSSLIAL